MNPFACLSLVQIVAFAAHDSSGSHEPNVSDIGKPTATCMPEPNPACTTPALQTTIGCHCCPTPAAQTALIAAWEMRQSQIWGENSPMIAIASVAFVSGGCNCCTVPQKYPPTSEIEAAKNPDSPQPPHSVSSSLAEQLLRHVPLPLASTSQSWPSDAVDCTPANVTQGQSQSRSGGWLLVPT